LNFYVSKQIIRLSTTRVKLEDAEIRRLSRYEAEVGVNLKKLNMFMSDKERGVCTNSNISAGMAVCEYVGNQISEHEAIILKQQYANDGKGCFIFDINHHAMVISIDATAEDGTPGRLINHSLLKGNLTPKLVHIGHRFRIFLVAKQSIPANKELLYDYGDRKSSFSFLRESPAPVDVDPIHFCYSFKSAQVNGRKFDLFCNRIFCVYLVILLSICLKWSKLCPFTAVSI
jgi:hypothetical protein